MLVTLSSDFGWDNEGPGVMAATILGICPEALVVHLSHGIAPFSIMEGARQMECVTTVPKGVHVCVVDPGVGSDRLGVVLNVTRLGYLVGPDNGVLIAAANRVGGVAAARRIDNSDLLKHPVSSTFHGRDIFASVAGHLARGVLFEEVGDVLDTTSLVAAPYSDARFVGGRLVGTVIHINRFGNCILNVNEEEIYSNRSSGQTFAILKASKQITIAAAVPCFSSVAANGSLLYPDSYGRVALAINHGDAAREFNLGLGMDIEVVADTERS